MAAVGIEESKEVLVAVNDVAVKMIGLVKKGMGLNDIVALLADEELKASIMKAVENISKVPSEISSIDLAEGLELVQLEIGLIPKIMEALKG